MAYNLANLQQDLYDTLQSGTNQTNWSELNLLWPHYPVNQVVTVLQQHLKLLDQRYYLALIFEVITALPSLTLQHLPLLVRWLNLWHLELSLVQQYPTAGQNLAFFVNGHSLIIKVAANLTVGLDQTDRHVLLTWLDSYAETLQRLRVHPHYRLEVNLVGTKASRELTWIQTNLGLLKNYP